MSERLTGPQRRALAAVKRQEIFWRTPWGGTPYYSTAAAGGVQAQTVQILVDRRLACVGSAISPLENVVELTAKGKEALNG